MMATPVEDGLHVDDGGGPEEPPHDDGADAPDRTLGDTDLDILRDAFVEGFNDRDLEALLALVDDEVECPDILDDGPEALAEEVQAIWERSPGAMLTRALLDGTPCAVGWLPDENGRWTRAALVCFDAADGLLTLVEMPDDPVALETAEAAEPTGGPLDEWIDA